MDQKNILQITLYRWKEEEIVFKAQLSMLKIILLYKLCHILLLSILKIFVCQGIEVMLLLFLLPEIFSVKK